MNKCIFLAGASGAIGQRLAPLLVADGWRVVGTTRSADKAPLLRAMGVDPVVVDVFDAPRCGASWPTCGPRSSSTSSRICRTRSRRAG
jgi:nucleoside-diphosphate-sugar epimerase